MDVPVFPRFRFFFPLIPSTCYWGSHDPCAIVFICRTCVPLDLTLCGDVEPNPGPYGPEDSPTWLVTDDRAKAEQWAAIMNNKGTRDDALAAFSEFFRGRGLRHNGNQEPFLVDMVKDGFDLLHCTRTITELQDLRAAARPYVSHDPIVRAALNDQVARDLGAEDARRERERDVVPLADPDEGPPSLFDVYRRRGRLCWVTELDPYVIHQGLPSSSWLRWWWSWAWRAAVFFVLAVFFSIPVGFAMTYALSRGVRYLFSPTIRHWQVEIVGRSDLAMGEDRPAAMSHQKVSRLADYADVRFEHFFSRDGWTWGRSAKIEQVALGTVAEVQNSVGYITDTTKFERYEVRIAQCFNVGLQASRLKDYHGPVLKMLVALAMDEKMRRTSSDDLLDFHVGPTRRVGPAFRY